MFLNLKSKLLPAIRLASGRRFGSQEVSEQSELISQTYKQLLELSHSEYPKETHKVIDDIETGFKYARSSLGLWGLNKAFQKGVYKISTTDFDLIKEQNA